jgi:hypothetical protein
VALTLLFAAKAHIRWPTVPDYDFGDLRFSLLKTSALHVRLLVACRVSFSLKQDCSQIGEVVCEWSPLEFKKGVCLNMVHGPPSEKERARKPCKQWATTPAIRKRTSLFSSLINLMGLSRRSYFCTCYYQGKLKEEICYSFYNLPTSPHLWKKGRWCKQTVNSIDII